MTTSHPSIQRSAALAALLYSLIACHSTLEVGDNCAHEECVATAEVALASCQRSCTTVERHCPAEAARCDEACTTEIDDGGYRVCQAQFDALHECCERTDGYECEYPGLDECAVLCPKPYLAYRTCTRSEGERKQAHEPGETIAGCIDICAQIRTGCPGSDTAFETCIEECLEEEQACADPFAWLELSACCAGTDYQPICGPEQEDLDIKRCRSACPGKWDACETDEQQ